MRARPYGLDMTPASQPSGDTTAKPPAPAYDLERIARRIKQLLRERGPITGGALCKAMLDIPPIVIWRVFHSREDMRVQNCARYYLRYDIRRDNALRLSPSILRDFLTFSLVHLPGDQVRVVQAGTRLSNRHRRISLRKLGLARRALLRLPSELQDEINRHCVVFLSGDISYYLAHATMRRHEQLGTPVRGSDIDVVIIANAEADADKLKRMEAELLSIKQLYLMSPNIREELDFIVKPIGRMVDQLEYRDIHEKIASKILYESFFLMGRVDIYESLMQNMTLRGTRARIEEDFEVALGERQQTIAKILALPPEASADDPMVASLFFASQERLEFQ